MTKTYRNLLKTQTIYDTMPDGWGVIDGAMTAPNDYVWIHNRKSLFSGEHKQGLLKL